VLPAQVAATADNSASNEDLADNVFLPPDRRTLQRLSQAKDLIAKGRYGEAVRNLGVILESPEDFFFQPQKNQPIHRSLKAEAQHLIGQMPREGRELYELEFGAKAKQLLQQAVAAGDAQGLAQVSQRFFHTRAGYEATFLLGLHHLDHGRHLAGALTLQRLADSASASDQFEPALSLAMAAGWLQAGEPDKAREALLAFRRNHPQLAVKAAAGKVPLFTNGDEALDWLIKLVGIGQISESVETDRWLMFRGNPQRNAIATGGAPFLSLCWQAPATDDPLVEEVMPQIRQGNLEQGLAVLPGLHPLAVDDVILIRTYKNLQALDFTSGKRLWEVPADDSQENSTAAGDNDSNMQASLTAALLSHRALNDATFGTLSSDGRLVFAVEDPEPAQGMKSVRRVINFNNPVVAKASNRLAAYDIRTGKLKWQVGGDADDFAVRLPETFFLGPPLPLMGQLYVLAEMKGEIRLLALDAANGNLSWSQQLLAVMEQNIQQNTPVRRTSGISPSYAEGILVCPTSTGAVVAVELATRSLLWGYRYGHHDNQAEHLERMLIPAYGDAGLLTSHANDAGVCIADGLVLVTPIDSDSVHCLNLSDGELRWKYKCQDDMYLACVHQGKVVLAGRHQVRAIRLADGKPDWGGRVISLPEGVMPSGRGFFNGDRYFLPLDSAEVAAIDLAQGKIIHLSKSRKGFLPGNLICYKGRVISQGYEGVDVFYQIDAAETEIQRRLAADPADCDALCLQGEIFLDADKRRQAIDCFRRAYAADPDPRARELLRDALLEGLQQEFAAYRGQTAEIEQILDDPSQQANYLRLMAVGLHRAGDLPAAFEHCQRLMDLETDVLPLETAGKSLSVRRDRWIQALLASIVLEAKGETAEKIDAAIRARFQSAAAPGSIEALKRFLAYFGNQPIAGRAREVLVRKLMQDRRMLEAEIALCESFPPSDPAANAPALAELAGMLREAGQEESAASTYNWLRRRFGNAACREGKTAEQIINDLPADDAVRELLDRKDPWPVGDVENAAKDTKNTVLNNFGRLPVIFKGFPGPYFENVNLTFDQNRHVLSATDGLGNDLWKVVLDEDRQQRQQYYAYNPGIAYARALGHLLLFSAGGNLFAIDTLRAGGKNPPKILWSSGIAEASGNPPVMRPIFPQGLFAGVVQMYMTYNQSNDLEAAADRYICLQRSRSLYTLDPLTGATLWVRHDIPQGSVAFGDGEYVFVLPPDKPEALVLRALDGEPAGTRKITRREINVGNPGGQIVKSYAPLGDSCLITLGRNLLFWRLEQNHRILELFDPWTQEPVWPRREFSFHAQYSILGNELIGVLEPDGKFVLLNLADGRTIAEINLKPEPYLGDIMLIAYEDRFLLLTSDSYQDPSAPQLRPLQPFGIPSKLISKGRLYAIDGSGKLLWPEPVVIENQQLLTGQGRALPILLFSRRFSQKQNSSGRNLSLLAIDKRTGRTVYNSDLSKPIGFFNIVGNSEKKTVNLTMQYQTVTLTFTDNPPRPPDKQARAENAKQPRVNTSRALLKSLEKTMGQMFGLPAEDSLDEEEQ
jgi:outer membrane protein assembly factor BamB